MCRTAVGRACPNVTNLTYIIHSGIIWESQNGLGA